MPDENRFAGIGEAVEGDSDEADADGDDAARSSSEDDVASETPTDGPSATERETADDSPDDTAAFAFDDTVQKSVYVRPETFETLEDAEALVNAQLRTEHEIKNLTRREFFDAVFEEAAADTDRLVERIRRMREK